MRSARYIAAIFLLLAPFIAAGIGAQEGATPATGKWLDGPVENWNRIPLVIPQAPSNSRELLASQCTKEIRRAVSAEDRQVAGAGWALVAPARVSGSTVVVQGMLRADGVCRPLQYQDFVFAGGKFAGTLAPEPMDSRSEGAINFVEMVTSRHIHVQYSRYKASDPLCCPSRLTTIEFTMQPEESGYVAAPGAPTTVATTGR